MAIGKYQPLTLAPINVSLTEGTSIPAPVDTPPESPRPPTPGKGPLSSHPTPQSAFFPHHETTPPAKNGADAAGLHQTSTNDASSTLSPSSPSNRRPSSMRKFLGLRPLSSHDSMDAERPGSPATLHSQSSLRRKKSGSWFGSKAKRQSSLMIGSLPEGKESAAAMANGKAAPPEKKGPPPPALPELKTFGVNADLGADDMFKNID